MSDCFVHQVDKIYKPYLNYTLFLVTSDFFVHQVDRAITFMKTKVGTIAISSFMLTSGTASASTFTKPQEMIFERQ